MDIVVVAQRTDGCHLWAVHGETGTALPGFPIALPHKATISASVILVDLHNYNDPRYVYESLSLSLSLCLPLYLFLSSTFKTKPLFPRSSTDTIKKTSEVTLIFLRG